MKTVPRVDVVIIGGGWTGLLMAKELGSRTSLKVVVLERVARMALSVYFTFTQFCLPDVVGVGRHNVFRRLLDPREGRMSKLSSVSD